MRYDLNQQNINSKLYHNGEATVNENCEILNNILLEAKNKHIPKMMRKNNKRKDKKEKWMTSELLNQINLKMTCMLYGNLYQHRLTFITIGKSILQYLKELSTIVKLPKNNYTMTHLIVTKRI